MKQKIESVTPVKSGVVHLALDNQISFQQMYDVNGMSFSHGKLCWLKQFSKHPLFDKYDGLKEVVKAL